MPAAVELDDADKAALVALLKQMIAADPCPDFLDAAQTCHSPVLDAGVIPLNPGMIPLRTGRSEKHVGGVRSMLIIELTRGSSWQEPSETIDHRECETDSIDFAAAEALHWLINIQKNAPCRGATHYRVVGEAGAVVGGPH